ncbi:MAG: TRAP transporter small permease [Cardiobacteriaceae bacterium]|nr:TRAP transporter small permease [Cardiobacteriaceae bacterium]
MTDAAPDRKARHAPEDWLAFAIFWALVAVVFIQFFTRYVLGDSTVWTEEIARYLLILLGFFASIMAVRRGSHIVVDYFRDQLPAHTAASLALATGLLTLAFHGVLAWLCWKLAGRTSGMMVSIDMPKKVLYYAVFAALLLLTLRQAQVLWRQWRTRP